METDLCMEIEGKSSILFLSLSTVSAARSYDETTIQAPTKLLRGSFYDKQSSQQLNNDVRNI